MHPHNDLTFFTNEPDRNLYDRFNNILKSNTQFFDALVGYFRTSGFYLMYPAMKDIEKIRILVGINVDDRTVKLIEEADEQKLSFEMTYKKVKEEFSADIIDDLKSSVDSSAVEDGAQIFIEWLKTGKLEMRVYPDSPIHAKVYIMRKNMELTPDQYGSVITGSSNFSQSGLVNNLEFNVELKDSRDVQFALDKFEELWDKSIDIKQEYVETVTQKTWIRNDITPYELYLKTLYEYFKEEINEDLSDYWEDKLPDGFMKLRYQSDAVTQAKKILNLYGGVFISDVVGLGKTFICALLGQRLKGRKLVICPPVLIDYWKRTLHQFEVSAEVVSLGKLDSILEDVDLINNIKYVFIDEAHRFRNQGTETFSKLHQICLGKKIVLVTATPQNNYSSDIANQIFLFQERKNSSIIPNNKNIEAFFKKLDRKLKQEIKGSVEYTEVLKQNSEQIRDKVLRNIMVRRTRKEIIECYGDDIEKQGLRFPNLEDPSKIVYTYEDDVEDAFNHTIECIKKLTYARYSPLIYLKEIPPELATMMTSQRNMKGFMKSILVKRLESSFYAFKQTLNRFIESHEKFINMYKTGEVFISKKVNVYDLLDNGQDDKLLNLVEEDIVQYYLVDMFEDNLLNAIKHDLKILKSLKEKWTNIAKDPKKDQFVSELCSNEKLMNKKIIIFTESTETATYIGDYLKEQFHEKVLVYHGQSSLSIRDEIEANYNPNYKGKHIDNIQYLVTTDVLAEGINLHRSNVIVNYDLPWNPTKIMQRVGRINRVGTEHSEIYVFNFFPTAQANSHLPLEDNIILKIQAFHDTLGEDFKYLSDSEDVSSHNLYTILNSKSSLEAEENEGESELLYLKKIREIRDNDIDLYEKIKKLPIKMKSGKSFSNLNDNRTLSFIRKGRAKRFFLGNSEDSKELYFLEAMSYLKSTPNTKKIKVPKDYFEHLEMNKLSFEISMISDDVVTEKTPNSSNDRKVMNILKGLRKVKKFTDAEEATINRIYNIFDKGKVPSIISKNIVKETKGMTDPIKIYYTIKSLVPEVYFKDNTSKERKIISGNSIVILSEYLMGE